MFLLTDKNRVRNESPLLEDELQRMVLGIPSSFCGTPLGEEAGAASPATAVPAQSAVAPAGLDLPGLENSLSRRDWKEEAFDLKQVDFVDRKSKPVSLAK